MEKKRGRNSYGLDPEDDAEANPPPEEVPEAGGEPPESESGFTAAATGPYVKTLDVCPNCGANLPSSDSLVCLRCGFNLKTLQVMATETGEAAAAGGEIAAVEGVDLLFIGPFDLSAALGYVGQPDHPEVRACIAEVEQALAEEREQIYRSVLSELEHPLIETVLARTGGNQIKAAALLGINRNTLRKKITELGIEVPGRP